MFDALLAERQVRETTRGCDSKFVWAVRKACFRAGIVGAAGTDIVKDGVGVEEELVDGKLAGCGLCFCIHEQ